MGNRYNRSRVGAVPILASRFCSALLRAPDSRSRSALLVLSLLFLAGCGTTPGTLVGIGYWGGEGIATSPVLFVFEELLEEENLSRPLQTDDEPQLETDAYRVTGLVVVGNVSAYRDIAEKDLDWAYRQYFDFAQRIDPTKPPSLSKTQFAEEYSGWTKLKIFSLPGIWGEYQTALVPRRIKNDVQFSSMVGTSVVQGTAGLAVARTTSEGILVLLEQLCAEDSDYDSCSDPYRRGLFDAVTGVEVDKNLRQKTPIMAIDLKTFELHTDDPGGTSEDMPNGNADRG